MQFGGMHPLLVAALAVACCAIMVSYARFLSRVEFPRRRRVLALRAAALVCILLLAAGVRLRYAGSAHATRNLAILLDTSQSMSIGDARRGATRFEAAASVAKKLAGGRGLNASLFVFGRDAAGSQSEDVGKLKPVHPETPLLDTLRGIAGERPEGFTDVLVLSDGAETAAPGLDAKALREIAGGLPVHAIGFGGEEVENLVLEKLFADEFVVAGSPAEVEGAVSLAGAGGEVSVEALVDGERRAARRLKLKDGEAGSRFALRVTPEGVGLHAVGVRVRTGEEEAITVDNGRTVYVRVVGGRRKALYADVPRWEFKYLKRHLESLEKLEADFLLITPKGNPVKRPDRRVLVSGGLGKYRLVILGALGRALRAGEEAAVAEYVRDGGRLVVLGGGNSLLSARFRKLRGVLPVSPSGGDVVHGAFGMKLSEAGREHPVTRLEGGGQNVRVWENLPYLRTFNRVNAKEGAVVLAEHPWERCGGRLCPVITWGRFEKGTILVLAAAGWWRWGLDPDSAGYYTTFWNNAITRLLEAEARAGWTLSLPKRNFTVGEDVCLSASGGPGAQEGKRVAAVVKNLGDGSERRVVLEKAEDEDRYAACFTAVDAGDFSAALTVGGKEFASPEPFSVSVSSAEFLQPARNTAFLKTLAEATGGRYYDAAQVGEAIKAMRRSRTIKTSRTWTPLTSPFVYLLIIALLSLEWAIRRREGFV